MNVTGTWRIISSPDFDDDYLRMEVEPYVELHQQGDRVSGARKPATLQTGKIIQVPLFINPGDKVRVDTRSGEYMTRV